MKAKLILTAMAMPVLFAACTSDELVPMEQTQQSARPTLSKDFTLTTEFEGEADTRYAVTGTNSLKFTWTKGDKYGVATIDKYEPGENIEDWDIIYSIGGANAPFTYDGRVWTSPMPVGVGHNLFVYPHSDKDTDRAAASYSLPTVQYIENDNVNSAIEEGNKAFAAAILRKGQTNVDVKMRNLYAYPKFMLKLDNGLDIKTVDKVVLEKKNGSTNVPFVVGGGLDHKKIWDLFQAEEAAIKDGKTADEYWETVTKTDAAVISSTSEAEALGYTTVEESNYIVAAFPDGGGLKTDGEGNTCIDVRFMLPGINTNNTGSIDGEVMSMYIYTTSSNDVVNVYKIDNVCGSIEFSDETSETVKKRIFARNTSYSLPLAEVDRYDREDKPMLIATGKDDWNALVSKYGSMEEYATAPLKIAVVGDFVFKTGVALPEKAIFEVANSVSVEGTYTLKNVKATTVNVKSGAVLTAGEGFAATTIVNNGTVTFDALEDENDGISTIDNYNTVEVVAGAKAKFTLNNMPGATFKNEGTATVTLFNEGDVTNEINATLNLNDGINYAEGDTKTGSIKATETGVITNKSKIVAVDRMDDDSSDNDATKNFVNNGKFVNESGASVKKDAWYGSFNNFGTVEIKTGSTFNIQKNGGTFVLGSATQTSDYSPIQGEIVYYASGETIALSANTRLTKLYIEGSVVLTDYYSSSDNSEKDNESGRAVIVVKNDAALTMSDNSNTLRAITVEEDAELTITTGAGKKATIGTLTIGKNADVNIEQGYTIHANSLSVTEGSKIHYAGTFTTNTEKTQTEIDAIMDKTGASGSYQFNKANVDAAPEAAKVAAMNAAVDQWIAITWTANWHSQAGANGKIYYQGNPYDFAGFAAYMDLCNAAGASEENKTLYATLTTKFNNIFSTNDDGTYKNPYNSYFTTSVDRVFIDDVKNIAKTRLWGNTTNIWCWNTSYAQDATVYGNEDKAKEALRAELASKSNLDKWKTGATITTEEIKAAAYGYTIYTDAYTKLVAYGAALTPAKKYFVWVDNDLYKLAKVYKTYADLLDGNGVNYTLVYTEAGESALGRGELKVSIDNLKAWAQKVMLVSNPSSAIQEVQTALTTAGYTLGTSDKYNVYTDLQLGAIFTKLGVTTVDNY